MLDITLEEWLSFGFVAVLVNLLTTSGFFFIRNRRRALALLASIEFECTLARQLCTSYKRDSQNGNRAWAPAYRLALHSFEQGIPWLRDHGYLQTSEVDELARLSLRMQEVNRCLELVNEGIKQHHGDEDAAHFQWARQSQRCAMKCDHVLGPIAPDNEDGTVPGALEAISAARFRIRRWLRPVSWHRERPGVAA
jgi:hypothetical protein